VREIWGSIPKPIKSPTSCQLLAIVATLMCGPWRKAAEMGTAHSWHTKGILIEYNEDLIWYFFEFIEKDLFVFCCKSPETLLHLFYSCVIIETFWNDISEWLYELNILAKYRINFRLEKFQKFVSFQCKGNFINLIDYFLVQDF